MLAHCGLGLDASSRLGAFWSAWPQLRAGEDRRVGHCGRSERICASWSSPPQEFGNVEPVIGGWRNGGQPRFQFVDFGAECEIFAPQAGVFVFEFFVALAHALALAFAVCNAFV